VNLNSEVEKMELVSGHFDFWDKYGVTNNKSSSWKGGGEADCEKQAKRGGL
jgi:hypothetical protein